MTDSKARKVCVVLVDRANYGRMKPVLQAIKDHPALQLQLIASGSMVLDRFDYPVEIVRQDGFDVNSEIFVELEGSIPFTMAKSVGFAIIEYASELQRLKPDIVLLIGDRYETLSAAITAVYMNLTVVHIQGGEVSGSVDESARHCISKLAQFHYPSTQRSADYLLRMGEHPNTILGIGCPSSDIAKEADRTLTSDVINSKGRGCIIDVEKPFLLTVFHPTTTEFGAETSQIRELLNTLNKIKIQTLILWPNIDAGSTQISKVIRAFLVQNNSDWLRTIVNFSPEDYLRVLANTACAVGNSSSFARDASYFGTPVVLIGSRQNGRETDVHVKRVPEKTHEIEDAIRNQLSHGHYRISTLYGDGKVSRKIVDGLARLNPYIQKHLHYAFEECG